MQIRAMTASKASNILSSEGMVLSRKKRQKKVTQNQGYDAGHQDG